MGNRGVDSIDPWVCRFIDKGAQHHSAVPARRYVGVAPYRVGSQNQCPLERSAPARNSEKERAIWRQ